ncbi:TolC family outer membrane protein [Sphingomonas sp. LaA6.9]|uniref:TolC family outer membrane protein n=1 Tax=Sphingomonas sp. LaA6.9 TaxID=2919914 RepID=UPI001F4FDB6F|nr:TolC family outer membrane protein [Sphingomonas sp. LaA6.9]MCJ8155910.1 TolC family outer membrane protein [Sphingomonas sp. LaA6.9]
MLAGATIALALLSGPASAETLREALAKAYRTNPTMTGARAGQRAEDENVPLARAPGLPSLGATANYTEVLVKPANSFNAPDRSVDTRAQLEVPLYRGGGVKNAIRAADRRVEAGQANLRGTESTIFSNVVAAYMDVLADSAIVSLNRANVGVLEVNLQATKDRFEVGDLTRTDIAQSDARLAIARSDLQTAEAQLVASKERYIRFVGAPPENLELPPPLPNLPESPDAAVDIALVNNPDLLAAAKQREAAAFDVRVAGASRMPSVSAVSNGSYTNYLGTLGSDIPGSVISQTSKQASVGVSASIPLYQGGAPSAQVRQAQARESQTIEQQIEVERGIIAQTRAAYAAWRAANDVINSSQQAVAANTLSLEGVRAENSVGTRTILDILNAEQELLNSQVLLVTARRTAYVAGFTLLAAMGQAEARDLGLDGGPLYDPMVNYKRVRNHIGDWDKDPDPQPVATRTVDTPAQSPSVIAVPN